MRTATFLQAAQLLLVLAPLASASELPQPGASFRVHQVTSGYQAYPELAMDSAGDLVISWIGESPEGEGVSLQRYAPNGAPLGGEVTSLGADLDTHLYNLVAVDPLGHLIGDVYSSFRGRGAYLRRYDRNGSEVGDPISFFGACGGSVHSSPTGSFTVLTLPDCDRLEAHRYDDQGRETTQPLRVAPGRVTGFSSVLDDAGHLTVVWRRAQGTFVRRYGAGGEVLVRAIRVASGEVGFGLAGNGEGRFALAWSAGKRLFMQLFGPTGVVLAPALLVSPGPDVVAVWLAMDVSGRTIVGWRQGSDPPTLAAHLRFYDFQGRPSGPEIGLPISRGGLGTAGLLSLGGGRDGEFVAAWSEYSPTTSYDVFARRLRWLRPGADLCVLTVADLSCDVAGDPAIEAVSIPLPAISDEPLLLGDLDGDRRDDPCVLRDGVLHCNTAHDGTGAELSLPFPLARLAGATPLLGDLDGDGRDDPCVFAAEPGQDGRFLCDTAHNGGDAEVVVHFGETGARAFLGDVDGDGDDDPCILAGRALHCDTAHNGGRAELSLPLPAETGADAPLFLADVNGDGKADLCAQAGVRLLCTTSPAGGAPTVLALPAIPPGGQLLVGNIDGF